MNANSTATTATAKRPSKTYYETEIQGPGRRFWFRSRNAAEAFAAAKAARGYQVSCDCEDQPTVWASFAKKRSERVALVLAGIDPLSL